MCDLQVSTQLMDGQVPTMILFEGGKETARLPHASRKGGPTQKLKLRHKDIVQAFGLASRAAKGNKSSALKKS